MKKLLVILPRVPWPLEKGDKLRAYYQIRYLSKHNNLILFALNDNPKLDKENAINHLSEYCRKIYIFDLPKILILWNIIKAFFFRKPVTSWIFLFLPRKKTVEKIG